MEVTFAMGVATRATGAPFSRCLTGHFRDPPASLPVMAFRDRDGPKQPATAPLIRRGPTFRTIEAINMHPRFLIMVPAIHAMPQLFTTAEAGRALPDVVKKFEYVLDRRDEVSRLQQQLSASAAKPLGEYVALKQRLNSAVTRFYHAVEVLEGTGVVVKSIDQGLLDFPSRRFGEDVWLCWKRGETEIKFWHEKDSGFMGRKPIEVSDASLV